MKPFSWIDTALNSQLPSQLHKPIVIVLDDDAAVRSSLKFSLGIEGFEVRGFSNAVELLHSPDLDTCSCLVIDQRLPDMSGLEFLALLRRRNIDTPAILITTNPDAALRKSADDAGVPIVEKPFLENTLLDYLTAAVHGSNRPT